MSLPKVFFDIPYPTPAVSFYDLPQSVRDQWAAWAKANRLGWLDYQYLIRQAPDAYFIIVTSDMMVNGGTTTIYNPPQWTNKILPALDGVAVNVTEGDQLSLRTSRELDAPVTVAIWATATDPTRAGVNNADNKFIGTFTFPAGTTAFASPDDLGTDYVAAFATLAADLGDFLSIWAFVVSNGNCQYVAGYSSTVTTVGWADLICYWPLNEISGIRRSIAQPLDLNPFGATTQTTGPIDDALSKTGLLTAGVAAETPPQLTAPAELTISAWVKLANKLGDGPILRSGADGTTSPQPFKLAYSVGSDFFYFNYTDAAAVGHLLAATTLGSPTVGTWYFLTATFNFAANSMKIYVDGAQDNTATTPQPIRAIATQLQILGEPTAGEWINASVADVGIWTRALSATEVAALYNAGAGLRYPFQ